jgi:hypothetical protein
MESPLADYFLCWDAHLFEEQVRPALARAALARSFAPCRALCEQLLSAARRYAESCHLGPTPSLVEEVAAGLPFDRGLWRQLVGEILLFAAAEVPQFPLNADTLCCILAPEHYRDRVDERNRFAPIQQAHAGSRDLTFGPAVYRPEHAGWNNATDVERLAGYLASVRPGDWTAQDLEPLRETPSAEDRADELEFVKEWFPALVEMYRRAHEQGQVIVCERIW